MSKLKQEYELRHQIAYALLKYKQYCEGHSQQFRTDEAAEWVMGRLEIEGWSYNKDT